MAIPNAVSTYGETDAMVNEKIRVHFIIICNLLSVLVALAQERQMKRFSILGQLQCALQDIPADQVEQLIVL